MAEGNEHSGKSYGGRRGYGHGGSGRPSGRGGKGFKPRGKGGFHKGNGGGFHKGPRRDGDGFKPRYREDGEGYRPRHDDDRDNRGYRSHGGEAGENPRYQRRDDRGGSRDFRRDGDRRDFRRDDRRGGRDFHRDGDRRGFHRDDRRDDRRGFRRDDDRKDFHRNDHGDFHHNNDRRDDRRDFRRDDRRREFSPEEKAQYREAKRGEYLSKPRRNSDGTMSFPSQNPYTARRPDEPKMPKGMEWSMLSKDERERLRGLSKEHAENIGLHILAAYTLESDDPAGALEHAKWAARQASRIDFARETLAFVAYRQSDYKLALREFRTAYRMNGFLDYLPFMADCERGLGEPKKAVELALSDDAKQLRGAAKAEMFLVYAGALADLEMWDKAIDIAHTLGRSKGLPGEYRMRAVQAEQYFLEQAGRGDEAKQLDDLLDRLEYQFAEVDDDEESDDVVIDHDLSGLTDDSDVLEQLGIDPSEAEYAPELEPEPAAEGQADDDADVAEGPVESHEKARDDAALAGAEISDESRKSDAADGNAEEDETQAPAEEAEDGVESAGEPAEEADAAEETAE